jgi:predicted transcriptional regulator
MPATRLDRDLARTLRECAERRRRAGARARHFNAAKAWDEQSFVQQHEAEKAARP